MGTFIEFNDTLQITTAQGFPSDLLDLERHRKTPITLATVKDQIFAFHNKSGARLYIREPVRVYLAHNIEGEWLFWGRIFIQSQTIGKQLAADGSWSGEWVTSGTYKIVDLYEPEYQRVFSAREATVKDVY